MKSACFSLRPLAPWCTPWHADSLFGALCWELARAAGEEALGRVLQRFRQGPPPFVLSDAFPAGLLPCPLSVIAHGPAHGPGHSDTRFLTRDQFISLRKGAGVTESQPPRQQWFRTLRQTRSMVPRDGADPVPFQVEEQTWRADVPENERFFSVYARAEPDWLERLAVLFRALGRSGFGKRNSTGRGAFELLGKAEPCDWLEPLPFENAFVSLSHFVPDDSDPADGFWETLVKYPKMGGPRAASSTPLKGRLVLLRPGSCFRPAGRPRRWYGRMLTGLSPAFPDAMHYGLSFAVGIRWDELRTP